MAARRHRALAVGSWLAITAAGAVAVRRAERALDETPPLEDPHERLLPPGESLRVTTDDGAELAVTVSGADGAPTAVLAHCWSGGREVWAPVAHRLLRAGLRVVLYDQRGHGSSTVGSDGFTIARLGHDLRAVLEAVDARHAVLAGHSMGGMTVQSLACEHPAVVTERAKGIVLVATAAAGLSRGRTDRHGPRLIASRGVERALSSRAGHWFVRGAVGKAVRRHDLELTRDLFLAAHPETRGGWLAAMLEMDLREGIARIGVATTVIVGDRDRLTPPERAAEIAATVPGSRLVTLPHVGHMLPLESPDEVASQIVAAAYG